MGSVNSSVRNIAVMGGSGTGKTSLVEALLHAAGAIPKAGRVEDGTTVCDHDALAREMKHSIDAQVVHLTHKGVTINLIDTPGLGDFVGRSIACMPAVDMVMLVVDPKMGVDPVFRRLARVAEERNLPRMVVVNKIDRGDDLAEIVTAVTEFLGPIVRAVDLPAQHGHAVVDCFENEAGESDLGEVKGYHSQLVDQVVEVDDALMERPSGGQARLAGGAPRSLREGDAGAASGAAPLRRREGWHGREGAAGGPLPAGAARTRATRGRSK